MSLAITNSLYAKTTPPQNVHRTNGSKEEIRLVHRGRTDVLQRHWLAGSPVFNFK